MAKGPVESVLVQTSLSRYDDAVKVRVVNVLTVLLLVFFWNELLLNLARCNFILVNHAVVKQSSLGLEAGSFRDLADPVCLYLLL